jgi:hypothetical protein
VNHNIDIDNGLEDYANATAREQDEARFRKYPAIFTGFVGEDDCVPGDEKFFTCTHVHSLLLTGDKFDRRDHPFAYDGGFAELVGKLDAGFPAKVTFRWVGTDRKATIGLLHDPNYPWVNDAP